MDDLLSSYNEKVKNIRSLILKELINRGINADQKLQTINDHRIDLFILIGASAVIHVGFGSHGTAIAYCGSEKEFSPSLVVDTILASLPWRVKSHI